MTSADARRERSMKSARAALLLVLLSAYLTWVFRLTDGSFWRLGLGDWMDPYFSNALMEHWYESLLALSDPSSPPMYYPVRGTLGYSHGLVLYVPFYAVVRPFLHPFTAQSVMLLLVIATGTLCLFALFRRHQRLSLVEAILLTAFFVTSRNVTNGETGVWLQRASVFLIPPALLLLCDAIRMRDGTGKLILAIVSGLSATLMFTQDFQTALFTVLLIVPFAVALLVIARPRLPRVTQIWRADSSFAARAATVVTLIAITWTIVVLASGGAAIRIAGLTVRSHDWRRPALIGLAGAVTLIVLHRQALRRLVTPIKKWHLALATGALAGLLIFAWIYLPGYREHHAFPEQDLLNLLTHREPANWSGPFDVLRDLGAYRSMRSFVLMFALAAVIWTPPFKVDRQTRLFALVAALTSCIVIVLPIRFGDFSVWRTFFWPIPGLSAVRDPRRIIPIYELAVVLGTALFLVRVRSRAVLRQSIALLILILMVASWNPERFDYIRRNEEFDRWVAEPIAIDPGCTSFFMRPGPAEYLARQGNSRTLYGIDALFVALRHSIPTLNGYSAWSPIEWGIAFPEDPEYFNFARQWVRRHRLEGVCEFDLSARRMTLFQTRN
jgi:hypothetical protein